MKTSEKTDKIFGAIFKVKSEMKAVSKDTSNPFFKSKYATLNGHLEELEPLMSKNGLVLLQPMGLDSVLGKAYVETSVVHVESGQFVSSIMPLVVIKEDMQQLGAAATYARRFTVSALFGMQAEDLDGEDAVGRGKASSAPAKPVAATAPGTGFQKPKAATLAPTPTVTKPVEAKKSNPVTDDSWSS